MTLKEYLETVDQNERLYIGSKSGFFFIGTLDAFNESNKSLEKKSFNDFKKTLKISKTHLELIEQTITETQAEIDELKKQKKNVTKLKALEKDLEGLNKRLKQKQSVIKYYERAIETFKPFLERNIIYIHKKVTMPDEQGIAIKIEGYESGKYWTYQEWIGGKGEE